MVRTNRQPLSLARMGIQMDSPSSGCKDVAGIKSHKTYMGLPQMKLYDDISVYFQIKTLEPNGKRERTMKIEFSYTIIANLTE